ncbi:MAG TPA: pyridoxamine 5'-phosphate oxidase family protein [Candidatus Binatia bacterium]|nr:pyridoxamine 5'-phosphate oxidase family protein [Candidatus Binatia bacterium]
MSVAVSLDSLRAALEERPPSAYLLTVGDDGRPHAVHVSVRWEGDVLVAEVGKRSAANALARPAVSLVYPLRTPDDYSLIVDGTATAATGASAPQLRIAAARAVLHRPAAAPDPAASCAADCVPLVPPSGRGPG